MNPLYSTNDSPNNQTSPSKAVNRQGVYVPRTHNTFDMSYFNFKTQRFGVYEPFFVMEGVPGDHIPFSTSHNVRSLPFATPFLSSLKLNKDFFLVPNQAIQPHTWELIFKNPSQGDDVPDDAYNVFSLYDSEGNSFIEKLFSDLSTDFSNKRLTVDGLFKLLTLEMFCSTGSLLYNCGYKLNPVIDRGSDVVSFDKFFDDVIRGIDGISGYIELENSEILFQCNNPESPNYLTIDSILDIIRFLGSAVVIEDLSYSGPQVQLSVSNLPLRNSVASSFNCDRLCAYQLVCAQYYVNPQVDFLYNAQLYRDNFLSAVINSSIGVNTEPNGMFFTVNGINVLYDSFSSHYYKMIVDYVSNGGNSLTCFEVLSLLFGYKESLKFGDYLTDSRTRPLAVGNTDVNVQVDQTVSVVDISQKIVLQRFLNNVIKLGNNFGDYLRGIFGTSPSPDYHFPKYIIHQEFDISGFETAQSVPTETSVQGTVTSQLMSGEDTFVFEVDIDMPCVLLGMSYFSVPQVYCQTKDRHFFHKDRFDFFNPMMQYTGDQPVYLAEKTDMIDPNTDIKGYHSRFAEYKQRVSTASGGFVGYLPAWSFVSDDLFGTSRDPELTLVQSPESIRHIPYQFNRFFKALSGYSLASAFHFIVVYNNKCMCNRPMEINPYIL